MYNSVLKNNFDFASLLMNLLVLVIVKDRFVKDQLKIRQLKDISWKVVDDSNGIMYAS